jgi:2-haloacid dehalogenase
MGLDKDNIGFVSSNFWDDAGAKAFGFRTHWINRTGVAEDELGFAPDVTLKSLTDLIDLVG